MKIIAIRFLNLNSLKGVHEIRFDQSPLAESGIFAITGATGSGKTTLLDAITVALYGRVHRHQKDAFEIMTRHTAEAYAEVEFEVQQLVYRARWSVRRARGKAGGQLQTPKMELADVLSGKIIVEHPLQEVKDKIAAVCGLDYSQFLRAVILSQGDFTRFLKADENERSELLEKITDTAIYSEISIAAFEKARVEKSKLEQLQLQLNHVNLLSPEIRSAHLTELEQLSAGEQNQKKQLQETRTQLEWLNQLSRLRGRQAEQSLLLEQVRIRFDAQKPDFERFRQHEKGFRHQATLSVLQNRAVQIAGMEKELESSVAQIPALKTESADLQTHLRAQLEKLQQLQSAQLRLEPLIEEVLKLDTIREQALQSLQLSETAAHQERAARENLQQQKRLIGSQLLLTQNQVTALQQWITDNQADQGLDHALGSCRQLLDQLLQQQAKLAEVEKRKVAQLEDLEQQEQAAAALNLELKVLANQSEGFKQQAIVLQNQIQQQTATLTVEEREEELRKLPLIIEWVGQQAKLAALILKNQDEVSRLEGLLLSQHEKQELLSGRQSAAEKACQQSQVLLESLQAIYELEVKVQEFEPARTNLKPEEPCPLCGSLHHPFVNGHYTGQLSDALDRRNKQQELLKQFQNELAVIHLERNTIQLEIKNTNNQLLSCQNDLAAALRDFETINTRLPKPLDYQRIAVIEAVMYKKQGEQEAQQKQLQAIRTAMQELQTLELRQGQHQEKWSAAQHQAAEKELTIKHARERNEEFIQDIKGIQLQLSRQELELQEMVQPFGFTAGAADRPGLIPQMQERLKVFKEKTEEDQQGRQRLSQLENELSHAAKSLEEKEIQLEKAIAILLQRKQDLEELQKKRFELFADADPRAEREKNRAEIKKEQMQMEEFQLIVKSGQEALSLLEDRISQLERNITELRNAYTAQAADFLVNLNTAGISSIAELESLLLPEDEAQRLGRQHQEIKQELSTLEALLTATAAELQTENARALTEADQSFLLPQLAVAEEMLKEIIEQKFKLKQILAEDEVLQNKHAALAAKMQQQEQETTRFAHLSALIGSADGKRFSRFAQGLTLSRLTALANRHLLKLTDRYQILKTADKDLDLQIIDSYQADVVRPMTTLSGGESFLVSLSLALGLSDLASKKVQINSLFIDEGFGTLDAETLDTAITALENLQSNGKSIGIISHVEALKERINTQIRLEKMPGGSSRIRITSGGGI